MPSRLSSPAGRVRAFGVSAAGTFTTTLLCNCMSGRALPASAPEPTDPGSIATRLRSAALELPRLKADLSPVRMSSIVLGELAEMSATTTVRDLSEDASNTASPRAKLSDATSRLPPRNPTARHAIRTPLPGSNLGYKRISYESLTEHPFVAALATFCTQPKAATMILQHGIAAIRERRRTGRKYLEFAIGATNGANRLLAKSFGNLQQQVIALPAIEGNRQTTQQQQCAPNQRTSARSSHLQTTDGNNDAQKPAQKPCMALDQLPLVPLAKAIRPNAVERRQSDPLPLVRISLDSVGLHCNQIA